MRLLPTGRVEVIAGTSPHGQGHETTFGQIAADAVGVPFDDIDVMHGDTDVAPWGLDTYGSRSIVVGGEAVLRAARQVVDKARVVAAHLLEVSPGDLEFGGGRFSVRGDPDASRTIQDVAFAAFAAHDLPPGADRTETPATTNPLGVKGAGEAGTIGSTPAVVNAVVDALRPYGVTDIRMPCTPERVWRATHGDA